MALTQYNITAKFTIAFVKASDKLTTAARTSSSGLLTSAQDWELKIILEMQLKFPKTVVMTSPDMVLISEASKQIIILELTVPWESTLSW